MIITENVTNEAIVALLNEKLLLSPDSKWSEDDLNLFCSYYSTSEYFLDRIDNLFQVRFELNIYNSKHNTVLLAKSISLDAAIEIIKTHVKKFLIMTVVEGDEDNNGLYDLRDVNGYSVIGEYVSLEDCITTSGDNISNLNVAVVPSYELPAVQISKRVAGLTWDEMVIICNELKPGFSSANEAEVKEVIQIAINRGEYKFPLDPYYVSEFAKLGMDKFGAEARVKITSNDDAATKWLTLNNESASALVAFLKSNFTITE